MLEFQLFALQLGLECIDQVRVVAGLFPVAADILMNILSCILVRVHFASKLVKLCLKGTKLCLCFKVTLGDAIYTQSILVKLFLER